MSEYFYVVTVELHRGARSKTCHGTVTPEPSKYTSTIDAMDLYYAVMNDVYEAIRSEVGYMPVEQVAQEVVGSVLMYHVQPLELPQ